MKKKDKWDIFDYFTDAIYVTNYQDIFIYANHEACRFWGKKKEEIEGFPIFVVFPQAKGTVLEEKRNECLESGKAITSEIYFPSPPYEGWLELNHNPCPDGIITRFRPIKEKKKANQNIDFLYELISLVLKQFQFPVFITDLRYKIKEVNQAFLDLLDIVSKTKIIGLDGIDLVFKSDKDNAKHIFEAVYKKNRSQTFNYLDFQVTVSTIFDYFEMPMYYLVFLQNKAIPYRGLETIIPNLSKLVENSPDWIFIKNQNSQYIFVNPTMCKDIGKPEEFILGKSDIEIFGAKASEIIRIHDAKVLNGSTVQSEHVSTLDKENSIINTVRFPFFEPSGYVIGICGIARKIDSKKNNSDSGEIKDLYGKDKEGFYSALWDQSDIPSAIFNVEGDLVNTNQALLTILSGQIIKPYNLLSDPTISWETKKRIKNNQPVHSERYFSAKEAKLFFMNKTMHIKKEYYWDVFIKPLFNKTSNKKIGYLMKIIDLMDRKKREDANKRVYYRFVAGLKDIMYQMKASISDFMKLMQDNEELEGKIRTLKKQKQKINLMMNDLMKFHKLESEFIDFNFIPGYLNNAVKAVLEESEEVNIFSQSTIYKDFDPGIPEMMIDTVRFSQALHNICDQIIKHKYNETILIKTYQFNDKFYLLITNDILIQIKDGLPEIPSNPEFDFHFGLEVSRNIFSQHNGLFKYFLDENRYIYFVSFFINPPLMYNDEFPSSKNEE